MACTFLLMTRDCEQTESEVFFAGYFCDCVERDAQRWKELLAAALGGGEHSAEVVRGRYRIGPACCVLQTGRGAPGDRRGRIAGQNWGCSI